MAHQGGVCHRLPASDRFFPPTVRKNRDSQNSTEQRHATRRHTDINYWLFIHRIPILISEKKPSEQTVICQQISMLSTPTPIYTVMFYSGLLIRNGY
jgi:hypothetical protein